MSDLNVTEGDWVVSTEFGYVLVESGTLIIADCDVDILPVDEIKSNAYLFAQANNMHQMLSDIADDNRGIDDGFVSKIDELLNACKPPENGNEL